MAPPGVRRADFLMALAYATDLATGHSRDFALRSCVLGMRFADVAGLDHDARRRIYHQALLRYIGCNADTHLLAAHWGDEITLRRELHHIDMGNRAEFVELMVRALKRKFAGAPPQELEEAVTRGLAEGPQVNIPILSGRRLLKESRSASACQRTSAKVSARSTSAGTARGCREACQATR
jgi:hypothetical protein